MSWNTLCVQVLHMQNRYFTMMNGTKFGTQTFLEGHGVSEHLHWPSEPGVPTVERVYGDTQA